MKYPDIMFTTHDITVVKSKIKLNLNDKEFNQAVETYLFAICTSMRLNEFVTERCLIHLNMQHLSFIIKQYY